MEKYLAQFETDSEENAEVLGEQMMRFFEEKMLPNRKDSFKFNVRTQGNIQTGLWMVWVTAEKI